MKKNHHPHDRSHDAVFWLQVGAENKAKPSTKEKPELIALEITGKLTKKESEG